MARQDDIKKLLVNHNRRLQALQERKALYGLEVPIAVLTEIEDIEAEIERLQAELAELVPPSEAISQRTNLIANRFEIKNLQKDLLGRGGMGNVYRAADTQTGDIVAIKALKSDVVSSNPEIVARFVREGEALRQLNHPNIVKMLAAIEEQGQHFLVMEYVSGGSLQDLLKEQEPLSIPRVVEIALDLADALTRAHRLNIIHRDLKPANVLLAEDGTPRLTDFGIARLMNSEALTETGAILGTPQYLSPEACQGQKVDTRTDIWAFGVLLFEMLTGQSPFTGDILPAVLMAIMTEPVPDLSQLRLEIPDALADLVYRMLEKEVEQRIPSIRLVGVELEAILEERNISPTAPPSPTEMTITARPRRFELSPSGTVARKHNLPVQPTPIVGRVEELAQLNNLLANSEIRLITILGSGGMGKTRLALETAAVQVRHFTHGVYFVSLAPLESPDSIVPTIAEALNFSFYESGTPRQQLLDYLRQKFMLLVLDNFEHLLDGVELIVELLKIAPNLKVLVTSRVKLNVQGEQLFQLSGIDTLEEKSVSPEEMVESDAVKLFLQSARRAQPNFDPTKDALESVNQICHLVQGMPLGIILAAAWVEILTPDEIVAEIRQGLDFLETDMHDVPERQRSLRAVFDYSWNLLTEREQQVLQGLSIFRGGFTRQAAQVVTEASLRELMVLVNKSLLLRAPTGRYEIHEILRQYAAEHLDQTSTVSNEVKNRHSSYYAEAMQHWITDLKGPRYRQAKAEIEMSRENIRIAWDWAVSQGQVKHIEQLVDGLPHLYEGELKHDQKREAACQLATERLTVTDAGEAQRALVKVWTWQSIFNRQLGEKDRASQLLQDGWEVLKNLEIAGQDTRLEKAHILRQKGFLASEAGNLDDARTLYSQSLAYYEAVDERWWQADMLLRLSRIETRLRDFSRAKQLAEDGLALFQVLADQIGIANSLMELGHIVREQNQLGESEDFYQEAVTIYRETGNMDGVAYALGNLGGIFFLRGKKDTISLCKESLMISNDLGNRRRIAFWTLLLASADLGLGRYEEARAHCKINLSLAKEIGYQDAIGGSLLALGSVSVAEEKYAEAQLFLSESIESFRVIKRLGQLSAALANMGRAARSLGNLAEAQQFITEALQTTIKQQVFTWQLNTLSAAALLLADLGRQEQAVELYALATRYPYVANSRWFEDVFGQHIASAATTLLPNVITTAQERGKARNLEATLKELLAEVEAW